MKVILDTNVLVSGLMFPDSIPGIAVAAWREGRFDLVVPLAQLEEIGRVLAYPKIRKILRWDDEASYPAPLENVIYGTGQFVLRDPMDGGFVLGHPLCEALDDLLTFGGVIFAVAALDGYVFGTLIFRHVSGGTPDTPQDRLFRCCH